ncbi:MAG: hypothetical protein HY300_03665 [Verrucomicrobia bacterium]|nr:hypothetical protein [Verrucomicrobiota bacterium]
MTKILVTSATVLGLAISLCAQSAKPLYENNFEKAEIGKVPDDFLVLDGQFAVKQEGANKFLELPGAPLDTFGLLFGPTEKDGICVTARINGTGKGRRFPTLAVGLCGVGGYRLQVSPAKKLLELYRGDDIKATAPFEWQSGVWTKFRLQVRLVKDGEWKIEGKAWQSEKEPANWLIALDEKEAPIAGRASIWGNPFSGTPIQFDDLVVTAVK